MRLNTRDLTRERRELQNEADGLMELARSYPNSYPEGNAAYEEVERKIEDIDDLFSELRATFAESSLDPEMDQIELRTDRPRQWVLDGIEFGYSIPTFDFRGITYYSIGEEA